MLLKTSAVRSKIITRLRRQIGVPIISPDSMQPVITALLPHDSAVLHQHLLGSGVIT